jgi:hypothetical protein
MAITLAAIITRATFGDQVRVAGARANRGESMTFRRRPIFRGQVGPIALA